MLKIADAHAHLSELQNLGAVIHRATHAEVFAITSMGMDLKSNHRTLQLSEEYKSSSVKILSALGYAELLRGKRIVPNNTELASVRYNVSVICYNHP